MIRQVQSKGGTDKWTERNQNRPIKAKSIFEDQPFEKRIDNGRQEALTPTYFPLAPTQKLLGVGQLSIANLLGDVSGLFGVFFR